MLNALTSLSATLIRLRGPSAEERKALNLPLERILTTAQEGRVGGVLVVRDDTYSRTLCWQVRDANLRGELAVIAAFPSEGLAYSYAFSVNVTAH